MKINEAVKLCRNNTKEMLEKLFNTDEVYTTKELINLTGLKESNLKFHLNSLLLERKIDKIDIFDKGTKKNLWGSPQNIKRIKSYITKGDK